MCRLNHAVCQVPPFEARLRPRFCIACFTPSRPFFSIHTVEKNADALYQEEFALSDDRWTGFALPEAQEYAKPHRTRQSLTEITFLYLAPCVNTTAASKPDFCMKNPHNGGSDAKLEAFGN